MRLRRSNPGPHLPASCSRGVAKRVVTGQLKSTSVETLRRACDKANRLLPDYTTWHTLATHTHHRLKWSRCRSASRATTSNLQAKVVYMASIDSPLSCRWGESSNWSVHRQPGYSRLRRWHSPYLAFTRRRNTRFIIYKDGTATALTLSVGARVVTKGDTANPMTLLMKQHRGAAITSS